MKKNSITNYGVRVKEIKNYGGNAWKGNVMEVIYSHEDGSIEVLGEYVRNYPNFEIATFCPFIFKDKHYALYSKDYTCTSIMELPTCTHIGGETPNAMGFCPTGLWVPHQTLYLCKDNYSGKVHYNADIEVDQYDYDDDYESDEIEKFDSKTFINSKAQYHKALGHEYLSEKSANFAFVSGCVWGDDSSWKLEKFDLSQIEQGILTREATWGYLTLPDNFISLRHHITIKDEKNFDINENNLDKSKIIQQFKEASSYFLTVQTNQNFFLEDKKIKLSK